MAYENDTRTLLAGVSSIVFDWMDSHVIVAMLELPAFSTPIAQYLIRFYQLAFVAIRAHLRQMVTKFWPIKVSTSDFVQLICFP